MTIGDKLRIRRKELGLTMEEVGDRLGVQRSAVNKYEKNLVELKATQIKALAKILDVSVFYILDLWRLYTNTLLYQWLLHDINSSVNKRY